MKQQAIYVDDELFLGRITEQDAFRGLLRTVLAIGEEQDSPYIILIHGEGGMGKSQLTRRLRDVGMREPPFERDCQVLRVDWEIIQSQRSEFASREAIHPEAVLDVLHQAALDANWGRYFQAYQSLLNLRLKAEQEAAKVVTQQAEGSRYGALRDFGAEAIAKLVRQVFPVVGQTGEELTRVVVAPGIELGIDRAVKLAGLANELLKARLNPKHYNIYRQPHQRLARALGEGFKRVSQEGPLILIQDTYEIVALRADRWMRQAIWAAGPRVVWIIAGRDNLAVSRSSDRYVGYSGEFSQRLVVWDMQELAVAHVTEYMQDRAPDRPMTRKEALALHRATAGVPLALRQAADFWAQGVPLTAITEGIPDYAPRETIVRLLSERLLIHIDKGPAGDPDRRALYLLATQPRPDATVQMAVLRGSRERFDPGPYFAELTSKYSVVEIKEGVRLHEKMRGFVREYLMRSESRQSALVKDIAQQAVIALREQRQAIESRLPSLAERVEDSEDWQLRTLDLVYWLFWYDEPAAWTDFLRAFVAGLAYDIDLAVVLILLGGQFEAILSRDGRRRLKRLKLLAPNNFENVLNEVETVSRQGWLKGDTPEEEAEYKAILQLRRGRWLWTQKRYDEAYKTLVEAERLAPAATDVLRQQIGEAFYELSGSFLWPEGARDAVVSELGLESAQRAVVLNEARADAWYRLGVARFKSGHYEQAIAAFQRAIDLDPKVAAPHHGLGNVYQDQREYEQAIAAFQRAIDLDPKFAYSHHGLGNVYQDQREYEQAIAAYQRAIDLDPKVAAPHHGLGNVYRDQGQYEQAIAAYQRAIDLDPKVAAPHNGLGNVYQDQGHYEQAIAAFQRAIDLDPKYAYPHNGLGNVYREQGHYEQAIAAFQRAIDLDPKVAAPHHGLGNVYQDQREYEQAIAAFQRAIDLDPKDAYFHNNLGSVYRDQGQYEQAIAAFQRAIDLDSKLGSPHHNLAEVYVELGRLTEAETEFRERIRLSPDDALGAEVGLGILLWHQGKSDLAQEHFGGALEIWDTAWLRRLQTPAGLLENKALALLGLGRSAEALETLRQSLQQRLPVDTIDFYLYDLLAASPTPPTGLTEMITLLKEAEGEDSTEQ